MTTQELLCRHFSRIGARVRIRAPGRRQREKFVVDVVEDHRGELFELRCVDEVQPEILDVRPAIHHLVLMVRDGTAKNKYLLGRDERHWFAAAVPGDSVRNVATAIDSLRPEEVIGREVIRQGEWFFAPAPDVSFDELDIFRNEPLSRGAGSKPHWCEELARHGGVTVMVSQEYPAGLEVPAYEKLVASDSKAAKITWRPMVRDAQAFARGKVRHPDHRTVYLEGWHRIHMNRERFARHAVQVAFLD